MIQRSDDGGKTWEPVGQQVRLRRRPRHSPVVRRHAASVGVQARLASRTVADDPDTVYAGVEDAALFRTTDGGQTWQELPGLRGAKGQPLAARRRRHVPAHDPARSEQSRADLRRHLGRGRVPHRRRRQDLAADQPGLKSEYIPDPTAEVGHCVHRIAMHPSRPDVLFMQKHWDVMRSDNAGDSWHEVSGNLPTDFGFPIDVHAHEPETIYVVPIKSDSEHFPPDGKLRVYRSRTGGNEWEALTKGLPQSDCYVNVLRDAMAVDSLDSCGVYFGTTGGQVYASADAGDTWNADRPRSSGRALGRGADAAMIRVVLPSHLRTLAARRRRGAARRRRARSRSARSSMRSRRAIRCCAGRSATTSRRAPAVRAVLRLRTGSLPRIARPPLPDAVATGAEPFVVVGAMAGG